MTDVDRIKAAFYLGRAHRNACSGLNVETREDIERVIKILSGSSEDVQGWALDGKPVEMRSPTW